jgi:glyoxylase-like metal-dependent hydrolase (beta-lactamase superfamily II)
MAKDAAIQLADSVWRIPTAPFDAVNSYALAEEDGVTLVDCGLKLAPPRIVRGLAAIGRSPADVIRIVLTHAHLDHAGGAARMKKRTGAPLHVHEDDERWLARGIQPPVTGRVGGLGRLMQRMPAQRFPAVGDGITFADGDVIPVAGGLTVVHTPGHTPGHVSLLHAPTGVLITGDSIFNVLGTRWPPSSFCSDVDQNRRTAARLADLDYTTAGFTHGPEIRGTGREKIREFLRRERQKA